MISCPDGHNHTSYTLLLFAFGCKNNAGGDKKLGIRDGSFSHFSFYEKWEKEPSLIPSYYTISITQQ